jgi:hypothetical protein
MKIFTELIHINKEQHSEIQSLNDELLILKDERDRHYQQAPSTEKWSVGSTCIFITSLQHGSDGDTDRINFEATYTCGVIEMSETKLKIKTLSVTSSASLTFNTVSMQGCLDYMDGKWIDKSSADLIMDDRYNRMKTISDIINNG